MRAYLTISCGAYSLVTEHAISGHVLYIRPNILVYNRRMRLTAYTFRALHLYVLYVSAARNAEVSTSLQLMSDRT